MFRDRHVLLEDQLDASKVCRRGRNARDRQMGRSGGDGIELFDNVALPMSGVRNDEEGKTGVACGVDAAAMELGAEKNGVAGRLGRFDILGVGGGRSID